MGAETEPNGWELLRSIKDLKEVVERATTGMVAQATFALYQAAVSKELADIKADAAKEAAALRAEAEKSDAQLKNELIALRDELDGAKKGKARMTFAVVSTALGAAASLIVGIALFFLTKGGAG